jgi:putative ABC transport system substrate-binding protein
MNGHPVRPRLYMLLRRHMLLQRFILLVLLATALALVVGCSAFGDRAASTLQARVGVLWVGSDPQTLLELRNGLHEFGWVEGRNLTILERTGVGTEPWFADAVADLVQRSDVVVTGAVGPGRALRAASATIPIVFWTISDPIAEGFVASLAHPSRYATGLVSAQTALVPKRLEILKSISPGMSRVGFLFNPDTVDPTAIEDAASAARKLGMELRPLEVRQEDEVAGALERGLREGVDGLALIQTPVTASATTRPEITHFAAAHHLPAVYTVRAYVEDGGLVSYGPDSRAMAHRSAYFVDKILRGTSPGDLPMENPTKFEFLINVAQLRALGLTIPSQLPAQVTEWVQ